MKNLVITIPIDEDFVGCAYEIGYRLYIRTLAISQALDTNDPDALFQIFDGMDDPDIGIEYGFGIEITADKPDA